MSRDHYAETFGRDPWAGGEAERRGPGSSGAPPQILALHHDVFVIYRPLTACPFCSRRLYPQGDGGDGDEAPRRPVDLLPDEGKEYLCPHVRRTEYHALLEDARRRRVSVTDSAATTLANGTVQVLVTWAVLAHGPKADAADPGAPR